MYKYKGALYISHRLDNKETKMLKIGEKIYPGLFGEIGLKDGNDYLCRSKRGRAREGRKYKNKMHWIKEIKEETEVASTVWAWKLGETEKIYGKNTMLEEKKENFEDM